jgi:hypothetical protein
MSKTCSSCLTPVDGFPPKRTDGAPCPVAGCEFGASKVITTDPVNHPSHYTAGGVECIDALEAATINLTGLEAVCTANAIKYLWRWKQKNGHEDLRKARWYINKLLGDTP